MPCRAKRRIELMENPMTEEKAKLEGPDLAQGVALSTLAEGAILLGHTQGEPVILVRRDDELFAIGAVCTHYSGPLAEGLLVDDTVRCPWHHACFSLRTGEALRAPALNPVSCWRTEQRDGKAFVRERLGSANRQQRRAASDLPASVVIVGGGAAGNAAAEMLRQEGYAGRVTVLSADESVPYDRPNLSKNYLAGSAPEEWIPLRPAEFYQEHDIHLKLNVRVTAIDTANRQVQLADGGRHAYDALLLATGAEPVRLDLPGGDLPHVHYLRTLADSRALVAKARVSKQAVVIGASFIGLEVAASLRARDIDVRVVGLETCPMEKVLGVEVGNFVRKLHEEHGVIFHLGTTAISIDQRSVTLRSGETIPADLVVIGVGVRPAVALAEQAGLAIDRGVTVDEYLETSVPGIFAAGDIVRWPDRLTGERIRVEHWVVAERQGQTAARNILGRRERYDAVPFFWTEQYDFGLAYVGHAERFDKVEIDGQLDARDCTITYRRSGQKLAVAVIHRDLEGLRAEVEFERTIVQRVKEPATGGEPA
jgi:NADPH-dependent 2,4-dienoyl-CoA reductase/sulfur reductase-like enzyme/nitrite reductase/ring-hydroxylating ferredoxin subunit